MSTTPRCLRPTAPLPMRWRWVRAASSRPTPATMWSTSWSWIRTAASWKAARPSLLQEMKGDEYNDMIAQWVEELPEVTVNEATVEEVQPRADRQPFQLIPSPQQKNRQEPGRAPACSVFIRVRIRLYRSRNRAVGGEEELLRYRLGGELHRGEHIGIAARPWSPPGYPRPWLWAVSAPRP